MLRECASSSGRGCPYFDPDYETLLSRLNAPSVAVDNESCKDATLIKVVAPASPGYTLREVDIAQKHGILLDVVQILTDLELTISKAYISSDGGWFMDVFHVTDQSGNKITDESVVEYIQESLSASKGSSQVRTCLGRTVGSHSNAEHTAIELTGRDRPGLLSEISGVLTGMMCNVVAAEVWTHNTRLACVVYVTDEATSGPIADSGKLARIKERLFQVLKDDDDRVDFSLGLTHTERRLHQLMLADGDYESKCSAEEEVEAKPVITLRNCRDRGYSLVSVCCKDRPKLLFDTICTLTDMQYVVFHASATSDGTYAFQEYYIRRMDGCTLDLRVEREPVIRCLEAAIERRVSEGLRLELCTSDRLGLLSDVTRTFRENGLSVSRANVSTRGDKAVNVFYVTDAFGKPVNVKTVDALRQQIGQTMLLQVKGAAAGSCDDASSIPKRLSIAEWFLHSLGII